MAKNFDMNTHLSLAQTLAGLFGELPQVEAVALGGSLSGGVSDAASDIDLYVYTRSGISLAERSEIVARAGGASRADLGLEYWGPGDEWFHAASGIEVDLVYFDAAWMEAQISRLLDENLGSLGYSTCFWYTLRHSECLFDRQGWYAALQARCQAPYPEALRQNIINLNRPVLNQIIPAYQHQIEKAVRRGDLVSVNHRLAALFASYFDILFAANRVLHPGEKRLLALAQARCPMLPSQMAEDVTAVLRAAGDPEEDLLGHLERMIGRLEEWLLTQ